MYLARECKGISRGAQRPDEMPLHPNSGGLWMDCLVLVAVDRLSTSPQIGQRNIRRAHFFDAIPVLVGNQNTVFVCHLENNRGVMSIRVGVWVTGVFELDDISRANTLPLPVYLTPPDAPTPVPDTCRTVGQIDQAPALAVPDSLPLVFLGKGYNLLGERGGFSTLKNDRS